MWLVGAIVGGEVVVKFAVVDVSVLKGTDVRVLFLVVDATVVKVVTVVFVAGDDTVVLSVEESL